MLNQRLLVDQLYGIAYPLTGRGLALDQEETIRENVAAFCLAQVGKTYNKFLRLFYCSQLAYVAYLKNGIDLNTGKEVPAIPGTGSIIFPQGVWESCAHVRP